jgi:hypothetical protein
MSRSYACKSVPGDYEMNQKKYDSSLQLAFVSVFFKKKQEKKNPA